MMTANTLSLSHFYTHMYVFGFVSNVTFQTASFSNAYFLLHLLLLCRQTKLSFELG